MGCELVKQEGREMLRKGVRPDSGMKLTGEEKRPSEAGVRKVNSPGFYSDTPTLAALDRSVGFARTWQ